MFHVKHYPFSWSGAIQVHRCDYLQLSFSCAEGLKIHDKTEMEASSMFAGHADKVTERLEAALH